MTDRWMQTAVATLMAGVLTAGTASAEAPPDRLKRQINVMESIIDEVLVDSHNFLVSSRSVTHGVYLEEFGVVLTFSAALLDRDDYDWDWDWNDGKVEIKRGDDGRIIITMEDEDGEDDEDEDNDKDKDDDRDRHGKNHKEDWDDWRAKRAERDAMLYVRGKEELYETLMDYGETLGGLSDNQWVAIAAFLRDSDYFVDQKISRLILKARVRDLNDFADERINADTMRSRIVEEEY